MDDVFDAEETAEHMPLFPNTSSGGGKVQDTVSKIEAAFVGVFGELWEAAWNSRLGFMDFITDGNAVPVFVGIDN